MISQPTSRPAPSRPAVPLGPEETAPAASQVHAPSIEKRIICLDRPDSRLARLNGAFNRSTFEVYYPPRAATAIALCRRKRFDLVFVSYPMVDIALADFLTELRTGLSESSQPHVVVLAPIGELEELIDPKVTVLTPRLTYAETEDAVLRILEQPRRAAVRLMARLEGRIGGGKMMRICQTRNISDRGVFIACDQLAPVGTELDLELTLDPTEPPLVATVAVVRHSTAQEGVRGMGLRFVGFRGPGEGQLKQYLAQPKLWL